MRTIDVKHPWAAVWALLAGFFMIMVDSTVVTVASPAILTTLRASIVEVQWVTSAYLLGLAVPMLVAGRLGDRYGQKNLALIGLVLFTASSALCGLSHTIDQLIAARAFQGIGAACLSPQSMAIITRLFPPQRRGAPLGLWGASAGVAMLIGPPLGGVLVAAFGWQAVFFINIPIGVSALIATALLVPRLPPHRLQLDFVGVAVSALAILCLVVGLQEGEASDWGHIWGPFSAWGLIAIGAVLLVAFTWWELHTTRDPLVPIALFKQRNFALGSLAILVVGFALTCVPIPLQYYYQIGRSLSPTQAAMILIPMAVISGLLAPVLGRATSRVDPRGFAIVGIIVMAASTALYDVLISPTTPLWWFFVPSAIAGVGSALLWGPISVVATHSLAPSVAGTGSGVYNVARQLGSVLGAAAITSMMESHLTSDMPGASGAADAVLDRTHALNPALIGPFGTAMSHSLLLPLLALLIALPIAMCFVRRVESPAPARHTARMRAMLSELQQAEPAGRRRGPATARTRSVLARMREESDAAEP